MSSVIIAVCLVAFFGAAVLTIDAGSLWTTRRTVITGTDAAVLSAAQLFANGQADPCSGSDVAAAEANAANVLVDNHPSALHNATDTPNGFDVTLAQPCGTFGAGSFVPGKVRFDARLQANQAFSGFFGFSDLKAFSSSSAAWGYITGLGEGLRPIAVCDQTQQFFPPQMPPPPATPFYPHYKLWSMLYEKQIDQDTYDTFFGSDVDHYPASSTLYTNGNDPQNPNRLKPYVQPGANGHHTIHRIQMPDPNCGVSPGNRIWVDFYDPGGGTVGTSELVKQILYGYKGTVSLTPHDCNTSDDIDAPENCGSAPGDRAALSRALGEITCDAQTVAEQCPYVFPILVVRSIVMPGANAEYYQTAFLYVALRGFGDIQDTSFQMDFEFVDVMTTGEISSTMPTTDTVPLKGVQLCGADGMDRCGF